MCVTWLTDGIYLNMRGSVGPGAQLYKKRTWHKKFSEIKGKMTKDCHKSAKNLIWNLNKRLDFSTLVWQKALIQWNLDTLTVWKFHKISIFHLTGIRKKLLCPCSEHWKWKRAKVKQRISFIGPTIVIFLLSIHIYAFLINPDLKAWKASSVFYRLV